MNKFVAVFTHLLLLLESCCIYHLVYLFLFPAVIIFSKVTLVDIVSIFTTLYTVIIVTDVGWHDQSAMRFLSVSPELTVSPIFQNFSFIDFQKLSFNGFQYLIFTFFKTFLRQLLFCFYFTTKTQLATRGLTHKKCLKAHEFRLN